MSRGAKKNPDNWETRVCLICQSTFECLKTNLQKCCSRSCGSKYTHQIGDFSNQRKAASKVFSEMNKSQKGKTYDEIYGIEKSEKLRKQFSIRVSGEGNPAFGKNYKNGGRSIKGYYKGLFFRSLLEYSFMKHLENQGFNLIKDVDYECFHVPYKLNDRNRTYTIDFYVKLINTVYEVKPNYQIKIIKETDILSIKIKSAQNFFSERNIIFSIVTENDFNKISFAEALQDENVKFDERTFKYFNRR